MKLSRLYVNKVPIADTVSKVLIIEGLRAPHAVAQVHSFWIKALYAAGLLGLADQ